MYADARLNRHMVLEAKRNPDAFEFVRGSGNTISIPLESANEAMADFIKHWRVLSHNIPEAPRFRLYQKTDQKVIFISFLPIGGTEKTVLTASFEQHVSRTEEPHTTIEFISHTYGIRHREEFLAVAREVFLRLEASYSNNAPHSAANGSLF